MNTFYQSKEWALLRDETLARYGRTCMRCGSIHRIVVDHIKPIALFPLLCLNRDNLQVLCNACNVRKGRHDFTDYRPKLKSKDMSPRKGKRAVYPTRVHINTTSAVNTNAILDIPVLDRPKPISHNHKPLPNRQVIVLADRKFWEEDDTELPF